MVGDAALQPAKRVVARFQHAAVADHGGDKILKMQAGADHAALIGKQIQKTAIAARQGVVRPPQGKAVGNGVHRHIQPALRGFGGALGLGQGKVGRFQLGHGLLQRAGALLNAVLQLNRHLKKSKRVAIVGQALLHPAHQRGVDFFQFGVFPLQGGQTQRVAVDVVHAGSPYPMAMPVKVWLTCIALNCSP